MEWSVITRALSGCESRNVVAMRSRWIGRHDAEHPAAASKTRASVRISAGFTWSVEKLEWSVVQLERSVVHFDWGAMTITDSGGTGVSIFCPVPAGVKPC